MLWFPTIRGSAAPGLCLSCRPRSRTMACGIGVVHLQSLTCSPHMCCTHTQQSKLSESIIRNNCVILLLSPIYPSFTTADCVLKLAFANKTPTDDSHMQPRRTCIHAYSIRRHQRDRNRKHDAREADPVKNLLEKAYRDPTCLTRLLLLLLL